MLLPLAILFALFFVIGAVWLIIRRAKGKDPSRKPR